MCLLSEISIKYLDYWIIIIYTPDYIIWTISLHVWQSFRLYNPNYIIWLDYKLKQTDP
jgi:hypothetical protein